jgi:hypothetical protein
MGVWISVMTPPIEVHDAISVMVRTVMMSTACLHSSTLINPVTQVMTIGVTVCMSRVSMSVVRMTIVTPSVDMLYSTMKTSVCITMTVLISMISFPVSMNNRRPVVGKSYTPMMVV